MEAGVLNFWLCDRAFECDHCPLDRALRGGFHGRTGAGRQTHPGGTVCDSASLPDGIRFHPSHLWISPMGKDQWALGLDHQALTAFSEFPTLSLPRPGRRLGRGEELLALVVGADALRWPTPSEFIVLERNVLWESGTEAMRTAPYPACWALLVKAGAPPHPSEWLEPVAMQTRYKREEIALRDFLHSRQNPSDRHGATAADGGVPIAQPDRLVPLPDYLTFLRGLWGLMPAAPGY